MQNNRIWLGIYYEYSQFSRSSEFCYHIEMLSIKSCQCILTLRFPDDAVECGDDHRLNFPNWLRTYFKFTKVIIVLFYHIIFQLNHSMVLPGSIFQNNLRQFITFSKQGHCVSNQNQFLLCEPCISATCRALNIGT